jgi:hypothetical protein
LLLGWLLYAVGFAIHAVGHIRMGMTHTPSAVLAAGITAMWVSVGLLVMIVRAHRYSAIATGVLGSLLVVGLIAVHIPVDWGPLSQPWRAHAAHEPDMPDMRYRFTGYLSLASVSISVLATAIAATIGFRVAALRRRQA